MFGTASRSCVEAVPRVLVQEAQRDVVGRAAPGLEAEQLRCHAGEVGGDCDRSSVRTRVASSDWWASRNVVSVTATAGRARSQLAKPAGPSSARRWRLPGGGWRAEIDRRQLGARVGVLGRFAVRTVDGHLGEVGEQARAAVGARPRLEQVGLLLEQRGRRPARRRSRGRRGRPGGR